MKETKKTFECPSCGHDISCHHLISNIVCVNYQADSVYYEGTCDCRLTQVDIYKILLRNAEKALAELKK